MASSSSDKSKDYAEGSAQVTEDSVEEGSVQVSLKDLQHTLHTELVLVSQEIRQELRIEVQSLRELLADKVRAPDSRCASECFAAFAPKPSLRRPSLRVPASPVSLSMGLAAFTSVNEDLYQPGQWVLKSIRSASSAVLAKDLYGTKRRPSEPSVHPPASPSVAWPPTSPGQGLAAAGPTVSVGVGPFFGISEQHEAPAKVEPEPFSPLPPASAVAVTFWANPMTVAQQPQASDVDDGQGPGLQRRGSTNASNADLGLGLQRKGSTNASNDRLTVRSGTMGTTGTTKKTRLDKHKSTELAFRYVKASDVSYDNKSSGRSLRSHVIRLVSNHYFESASMVLIFFNAIYIGLVTDDMARNLSAEPSPVYRAFDLAFLSLFTAELLMRMYAFRRAFMFGAGCAWNWFDFCLVVSQLFEELMVAIVVGTADTTGGNRDGSDIQNTILDALSSSIILRVARILRAVRVLRVVRMAMNLDDLRVFVACLIHSGRAFFWSAVLLGLMIYVAAVYLTQVVMIYRVDSDWPADVNEAMATHFGSVGSTWLAVFEGLTGGIDWDVICRPLFQYISLPTGLVYIVFQAFAILAVMNVVSATFIQQTLTRAEQVKLSSQINRARKLFSSMDVDMSGTISLDEISEHLEEDAVKAYFVELDVDPSEAMSLFEMLDVNNSKSIDFEEFVSGCIGMQGPAKALDLLLVSRETRRAFERQTVCLQDIAHRLAALTAFLTTALPGMDSGSPGSEDCEDAPLVF